MKKTNLKKLAFMGIGGLLLTQAHADAQQNGNTNSGSYYNANSGDTSLSSSSKMSESDLLQKLTPEGKATYQGLSKEGKELALKLANQSCQGKNDCKGLNSCKSNENTCAGLAGCKGHSKGPFTDKNVAVAVAAKSMMEKRIKTMANGG